MKKSITGMLSLLLVIGLSGCGDKKFDGSEDSLKSMMKDMDPQEQVKFIKDFELASYALRGEKNLVDYSVEDVKNDMLL